MHINYLRYIIIIIYVHIGYYKLYLYKILIDMFFLQVMYNMEYKLFNNNCIICTYMLCTVHIIVVTRKLFI